MKNHLFQSFYFFIVLAVALAVRPPTAQAETQSTGLTERVSVASDGTQANDYSSHPSLSADGRYVAFFSDASNLVAGDTNERGDVFVYDRHTGVTERVSIASDGTQANDESSNPSISADGRYVAFESHADNLVAGDTSGDGDVFVRDRQTSVTWRVSLASNGTQGNDYSKSPVISADGRYVAFLSYATNLVSGDTNEVVDVFIHDRQTGVIERVSIASDGAQQFDNIYAYSLSADGRYVAFSSSSGKLVDGDTNYSEDVFVHDRQTGVTELVSIASDGTQGINDSSFPSISADGRYVAFVSHASNLVNGDTNQANDIFVHDRQFGATERVSVASDGNQGNSDSYLYPSISTNGRYVAFISWADNLVTGDTNESFDIFVHDRQTGDTERVSVASDGTQGNTGYADNSSPSISANGRYVVFSLSASNLVAGDTNYSNDIFVHDRYGILNPYILSFPVISH